MHPSGPTANPPAYGRASSRPSGRPSGRQDGTPRARALRRAARGFTLIELVAVLVIVGALAVAAMPNFVDLRADAYRASVSATAGSFASAIQSAHVLCLVRNYAGLDNIQGFGPAVVDFNANCYPSSTNGNNGNVNANRCLQVWNGVLAVRPSISTPANDPAIDYRAQGSGTTCTYTYRRDTATIRRFTYSTANGAVTLTNP